MTIDTRLPGGWHVTSRSPAWQLTPDTNEHWTQFTATNGARVYLAADGQGGFHARAGEIEVCGAGASTNHLAVRSDGTVDPGGNDWVMRGSQWVHLPDGYSSSTGIVEAGFDRTVRVWPASGTDRLVIRREPAAQAAAPVAAAFEPESDIALVDRLLKEEAVTRGWCPEYEAFVTKVNHAAGHTVLTPRTQRYRSTIWVTFEHEADRNGTGRAEASVIADAIREHLGTANYESLFSNLVVQRNATDPI